MRWFLQASIRQRQLDVPLSQGSSSWKVYLWCSEIILLFVSCASMQHATRLCHGVEHVHTQKHGESLLGSKGKKIVSQFWNQWTIIHTQAASFFVYLHFTNVWADFNLRKQQKLESHRHTNQKKTNTANHLIYLCFRDNVAKTCVLCIVAHMAPCISSPD
jgi:hypothetical protein